MELAPIPLFGLGNYSRSVVVRDQERVNLLCEVETDPERGSKITMYCPPGLTAQSNYGADPTRGAWSHGDFKYYVNRNTLFKEANDGTSVAVGTLATTGGLVDMAENGTQLMIVDGTSGYIFNFDTLVFSTITAPGFPANPTGVTFLNLRFLVTSAGTGQYQWSGINDGLAWDALDFGTEESNPDNLVRPEADNGQVVLFGEFTTGFAGATSDPDAAFARIGASALEVGLAARWSLAKFDNSLIFLSKNRLGGVQVMTLTGYTPQAVSNADIETLFSSYAGIESATGATFREQGHSFYQINFPSENVSWRFDGRTGCWDKVESGGGRHRAELFLNHQNRTFCTDYATGNTYLFDRDAVTDNGETIVRQFIARHIMRGNIGRLAEIWIDADVGVGTTTGQGANPQLMMQISKDGGRRWGNERWVSLGRQGQYRVRAVYRRLGRTAEAGDMLFKFRMTDPIKLTLIGAWARGG